MLKTSQKRVKLLKTGNLRSSIFFEQAKINIKENKSSAVNHNPNVSKHKKHKKVEHA